MFLLFTYVAEISVQSSLFVILIFTNWSWDFLSLLQLLQNRVGCQIQGVHFEIDYRVVYIKVSISSTCLIYCLLFCIEKLNMACILSYIFSVLLSLAQCIITSEIHKINSELQVTQWRIGNNQPHCSNRIIIQTYFQVVSLLMFHTNATCSICQSKFLYIYEHNHHSFNQYFPSKEVFRISIQMKEKKTLI